MLVRYDEPGFILPVGLIVLRAVLWKITPHFADWICGDKNPLFTHGILSSSSTILELGSGSAALLGLTLGARVRKFILSDQEYVLKLTQKNLDANLPVKTKATSASSKRRGKITKANSNIHIPDISAISLDWETDSVSHHPLLSAYIPFSAVIACDTIYNEALVKPFVDTCIDVCSLSPQNTDRIDVIPTMIIVAQELRSPDVFEHWLETFQESFHTYRIPDSLLTPPLSPASGYSVHIGIFRSEAALS